MSDGQENGVPWWRNHPWLGRHLFAENRNKNAHLLEAYNRMHVAWFPDGSGIRDADADREKLEDRIRSAGEDVEWYSIEYVSDECYIGLLQEYPPAEELVTSDDWWNDEYNPAGPHARWFETHRRQR